MKLTDIMIGDLVRSKDKQETIQVKEILNFEVDGIVHQGINGSWECFECLGWYYCDDIEPIPLTAEILEKNGGVKDDIEDGYIINNSIGLWLENGEFEYASITIKYVHEYQHLLRLCNLNDLADNFKI